MVDGSTFAEDARGSKGASNWRLLGVFLFLVVLGAAGWLFLILADHSDEKAVVYRRYIDAIDDGDVELAWALGCPADRETIDLAMFTSLLDEAVKPLGGLTSYSRLNGGPRWYGPEGSVKRDPQLE